MLTRQDMPPETIAQVDAMTQQDKAIYQRLGSVFFEHELFGWQIWETPSLFGQNIWTHIGKKTTRRIQGWPTWRYVSEAIWRWGLSLVILVLNITGGSSNDGSGWVDLPPGFWWGTFVPFFVGKKPHEFQNPTTYPIGFIGSWITP